MKSLTTSRIFLPAQPGPLAPALATLVFLVILVGGVLFASGGDPLALARLGTRYSVGDPAGTEGYDGQFTYYMSRELRPQVVAPHLDVPQYRYERILMSALVRLLSLGNQAAIPWLLPLVGVLAQFAGTWIVAKLLQGWGVNPWYAMVYGFYAGFTLTVRLDMPEPLAYALVAGALLMEQREKRLGAWVLYGLALFAKEVTAVFVAAQFLALISERRWKDAISLGIIAGIPYLIFQVWLWSVFGKPGIVSGGAGVTPFELVPFMGLLRIGEYSMVYLVAMLAVFGPSVVLPSIWGYIQSIKSVFSGDRNVIVLALLFNAMLVAAMPFSTFRETGGIIRLSSGLVLAILLFAARRQNLRVLNFSLFWLVLNVFLLK